MPNMAPLSDANPLPLYAQLAALLRQRIVRGDWEEGDRLPSHEELAREFAIARVTVRQAIDVLESDGLVKPRRGRGTFVAALPGERRRLPVHTTLESMLTMMEANPVDMVTIEECTATPRLAPEDGTPAPSYVCFRRLYRREGIPINVSSLYLDERLFRRAPDRLRREYIIPEIVAMPNVKIAEAFQTVTVEAAEPGIAVRLEIAAGAPIARLRRVFRDPDGVVLFVGEYAYRGDRVQLEMDLAPAAKAADQAPAG
jgi:GntR family transcriptional regulator